MARRSQHVVRSPSGWSVRKSGAPRVTRTFETQEEAIEVARDYARKQRTELFIHGKDGRVREKTSYGVEKHPPKG